MVNVLPKDQMTDFHDISFPLSLAFGASGGPSRVTEITQLASGAEHRNTPHASSRRRYNAGVGIKTHDELHQLITFFEARMGQLYSFRFRDPLDFSSCAPSKSPSPTDQIIGTGDGERLSFGLVKNYKDDGGQYQRPITKAVPDSVLLAANGISISAPQYSLDSLTGQITFTQAPDLGAVITAGFEFDVHVRFDTDQLDLALEAFGAGQAANIPLIEVRDHA